MDDALVELRLAIACKMDELGLLDPWRAADEVAIVLRAHPQALIAALVATGSLPEGTNVRSAKIETPE